MFRNSDDKTQKPKQENKSFGIITGGYGSTACTLFTNGAMVTAGKGKVTYTAPDGTKTMQEGSGYTATKIYHGDGKNDYDVKVNVSP